MSKNLYFKLSSMKRAETFSLVENNNEAYTLESSSFSLKIVKASKKGVLKYNDNTKVFEDLEIPKTVLKDLEDMPVKLIQYTLF